MSEGRRHPRVRIHQHVWCEDDGLTLYVRAVNASDGGLFLRTPATFRGRRLALSFDGPDGQPIVAIVEVVWSSELGQAPYGAGLRIVSFEQGADSYRAFVRSSIPPPPAAASTVPPEATH
jgi:hypothetical protein